LCKETDGVSVDLRCYKIEFQCRDIFLIKTKIQRVERLSLFCIISPDSHACRQLKSIRANFEEARCFSSCRHERSVVRSWQFIADKQHSGEFTDHGWRLHVLNQLFSLARPF